MRARALSRVRLLVPKPGSVKAWMRVRGAPRASIVLQATSRASVESRPAGHADARRGLADVLQALRQTGHLRLENLLAALAQLIASLRHEGMASISRRRSAGAAVAGRTNGTRSKPRPGAT